jgi:TRAP-type C4-dicarboxylate transport system permease small subunit
MVHDSRLYGISTGYTGFLNRIDLLLKLIIGTGIALIMFAIIFHVVGRYLFGKTYMGTMELIRYTMIWVSMMGASVAFRTREHICVNLLANVLNKKNLKRLQITCNLGLLAFLYAMVSGGVEISIRNLNQISLGMQIPMFYPYLAIPVGAGFMALHVLEDCLKLLAGLDRDPTFAMEEERS